MSCADFVGTLFLARDVAHSVHLNTRSFAKHSALNEFYDGIVDLADKFAEAYQGRHGLIGPITLMSAKKTGNIIEFLEDSLAEVERCATSAARKTTRRCRTSSTRSWGCTCPRSTSSSFWRDRARRPSR